MLVNGGCDTTEALAARRDGASAADAAAARSEAGPPSLADAGVPRAEPRSIGLALRKTIDELVRPHSATSGANGKAIGMAVAVIGPGFRDVLGYGTTTKGGSITPGGDTLFEVGSVTKGFTGLLLAEHVVQGKVALNDPVARFLPAGTSVPSYRAAPLTLLHLATHGSGLPEMPDNLVSSWPNPARGYAPQLLHDFLARDQLRDAPGTWYD